MSTQGLHSLDAGESLALMVGRLGFDEVDFTEHLTEGNQATATYWTGTGDCADSDGDFQFTVTNEQDTDLALAMSADRPTAIGEILEGLAVSELIATANDRTFAGASNWTNATAPLDINAYNETTDLTITADTVGAYCYLPVANALMTSGLRYRLQFDVANIASTWDIKDYTGAQTFGTVSLNGKEQFIEFVLDADLSGGLRIVAVANDSSADFDNFTLKQIVHVGHTFQVAGTGDTLDNDLATAKGSAVADNDTFVVTGITTQVMPNIVDRDFNAASAWANVDLGAYSETDDLTITAGAAGINDYCTLVVASAPMTAGVKYRFYYDLANYVASWVLKDFTGVQTFGTITANVTQGYVEFTVDAGITGGFRLVAGANNASGDFDNLSLRAVTATVDYLGNLTATYGFNANKRSTLYQTYAHRASAGYNLKGRNEKEYRLSYTITEGTEPDGDFALSLEGFGGDTELIGAVADREMTGTPAWTDVNIGSYDETFDLTMTDAGTELITETNARTFAGASSWTNGDYGTKYDETTGGILDLTSDAVGQYCTLPVAIAPMTAGQTYRFTYTATNIAESFLIQDFTGVQTFGTIDANGVAQSFDFTVDAGITGGFRITSVAAVSDINLDNLSLFHVGQGHYITLAVAQAPMTAGEYYELTFDVANIAETWQLQDFTGAQDFGAAISADGTSQTRRFKLNTGLTGGFRLVALDPVSSGDFDNFSLKHVTADGSVVDTAITLPHSNGAQVVFFKSNHNADVSPLTIVALCTTTTEGTLGIDTIALVRCCDNDYGDGEAWWKICPIEGDADVAALSIVGDNFAGDITTPTLVTLVEVDIIVGLFSRITGTSGIIHAYRAPYRS